jgi:predicted transposase/invertase (TIGR01784 family)
MSSTPHDSLFKHTFSQPQHAIELFRSVLPPAVVPHIDFDTLQVEPASFIDDELRARFSDLLFGVHLAGQPAYLYLLFEHQSKPERFMCRRLLRYVLDTWDHHFKNHYEARYLPVVIPIVLHHGEKGWTEPVSLRDLYDAPAEMLDALRPFLPELTFLLDDLAPRDDAVLRARALSAVVLMTLWAFKHVRHDRDVLPELLQILDLIVAMVDAPSGLAALNVLVRYIIEVAGTPVRDIKVILDQLRRPEVSEIVMTAAEQLREEGRKEGRKEGHKEGHKEGQRENLLMLLNQRFGPLPESVLGHIRRAELAQLQRWFERGITARSLDAVFTDEP